MLRTAFGAGTIVGALGTDRLRRRPRGRLLAGIIACCGPRGGPMVSGLLTLALVPFAARTLTAGK